MARDFDGTNDNLQAADVLSDIDVDTMTMGAWVKVDAVTSLDVMMMTASAISGGNSAADMAARDPASSGWKLEFIYRFSDTEGQWLVDSDLSLDTWIHAAITYDRSSTTNDPIRRARLRAILGSKGRQNQAPCRTT